MAEIYNEILIRNIDCGVLYFQIKDDDKIAEYEKLKKEKAPIESEYKAEYKDLEKEKKELEKMKKDKGSLSEKDEEKLAEIESRISELHEPLKVVNSKLENVSSEIFSFTDKNITLSDKNNRFRYSGTIADSLLSRKLRQVAKEHGKADAIKTVGDSDYTDVIINLKFKSDIMIPDGTTKRGYDPETESIVDLEGKNMKRLISKKKLRKMAYRDGVYINGVHYVNFQRTSSKARTGNCLFIDESYFEELEHWQNMGIPFRDMESEEVDIVGVRSYQSLISSSIIGELDIDPYSILLIDDVTGYATEECNVVQLNNEKKLEIVKKPYTQYTDLWDGQSLLDKSVFEDGTYLKKGKNGKATNCCYNEYGFILLRNHFFKTAVFNTNLQEYYKQRFSAVENPKLIDAFGNEFDPEDILMVTTRNSAKIFKFADIICKYMVEDDKKSYLNELEEPLIRKREELRRAERNVTTAKRNYKRLKNYDPKKESEKGLKGRKPPIEEEINNAINKLNEAEEYLQNNKERLIGEIERLEKRPELKRERERLTWDWYRETIKSQKQKFGCCKTEHSSKFGDKQQLWYQVIGSLNFDRDELMELVEPQLTELNLMKKHVAWFKRGLDMRATDSVGNTMMLQLLNINDDIARTKWYTNFRRAYLENIEKRLIAGKVQIKGSDFCTLVANPYEMLRASCGDTIDESILQDYECYCTRYEDGENLYGMRSPHICTGNNALLKNTYRDEWEWFNFTDNILIINFWGKGAFLSPKWNG